MTEAERFEGCILGGAIGDAFGSAYENQVKKKDNVFYLYGKPQENEPIWQITDDTQLTLATIEVMTKRNKLTSELLVNQFLKWLWGAHMT